MWRKLGVAVLGLVLIAAAGFGEQATDSRTEPTSTTMPLGVELTLNGPRRPDDEQMSALHALTEPPGSPSIAITSPGGHGHDGSQPASASSAPALVQQLDSARQAAAVLAQ